MATQVRLAKFDHTIYVTLYGTRTRHHNIEAAEEFYRAEHEGGVALIEFDDGSTEEWSW